MDHNSPYKNGYYDLSHISPDELDEMDQGRFLCIDCGEFYAPDGTDRHPDCPTPRNKEDYPPGLMG